MGAKLTPPTRREALVKENGIPERRAITFLENVATEIEALPDQMSNIADVTGGPSAADNKAKINEILAELISSGLMAGP